MAKGNRGGRRSVNRSKISYTEEELKEAVLSYAKDGFMKMRSDQQNDAYNRDVEILEDYISKQSDERTLYRGVRMSTADLLDIEVGGTIDQKGMSSWTATSFLAESFAKRPTYDGSSVVFILEGGTKKGADISTLKGTGRRRETETLISQKSKQVVTSIEWEDGVCYVRLKEK